jgi:putative transposase
MSYKYRIYPDKEAEHKLDGALDACRWTYNRLLEEISKSKENGIQLRKYDTQNMIPSLKLEKPELRNVYSKVLQMVNHNLWSNIKGLQALKKNGRKIGKLRFKGEGWYKTLNYNQSGFKIDQDNSILKLTKIGEIKIKLHRPIDGNIKAVIIKKSGNKWYAVVQVSQKPGQQILNMKSIGIDLGLNAFAVDSEGHSIENPRFAEKSSNKLKMIQKRLSKTKKGSNNRKKIIMKLDNAHEKINRQRNDFLHKLSRLYVDSYDIICVEDLDVTRLKEKGKSKGLHRNIHDASWSRFLFMLSYKAESAGKKLIKVDPRNTSLRCSCCGSIVKKNLSDRVHECPLCGFVCDRDYNASINILTSGMGRPLEPAELEPLHHISVTQVLVMNQEAPLFRAE